MSQKHFDLIVIGSGPAGEKGAAVAAYHRKSVAMIEKEPHLGGAAANTGTLPSKTLRETALMLSGLEHRNLSGLKVKLARLNVQSFLSQERVVKDNERVRIQQNLDRHKVRLFRGMASFADEHTLTVTPQRCDAQKLTADHFLIATGSYPYRPKDLFPFTNPRIYDSDTILTLHNIPRSLLVVGGGVIGCEYACIFNALGVEVTIIEKRDRLLGGMDYEISTALQNQMTEDGMHLIVRDEVAAVRDEDPSYIDVELDSGKRLKTEAILVSSGRSGQTTRLKLDRINVEMNKRGQILVNENFQTSVPHIYAAGDVVGNPALASTAMAQARMAMAHAFETTFKEGLTEYLPSGIYTIPECSMVGETEQSLQEKKIPYIIGRALYRKNPRGLIIGDKNGFLKLIFHAETLKVLGVHAIGEQATELIHIGLTAMHADAGLEVFIRTCYNYPTLSELYKYAAYEALGKHNRMKGDQAVGIDAADEKPQDEMTRRIQDETEEDGGERSEQEDGNDGK